MIASVVSLRLKFDDAFENATTFVQRRIQVATKLLALVMQSLKYSLL